MRKTFIAALALAVAGWAGSASAQTVVSSDITTNTTWSGTVVLDTAIFVKNGATLTILPGTIVRGQPRTGPVVSGQTTGTPGALIVTQTGRINAAGSPTNPIIFTTAAVDNDNDGQPDDVSPADGFNDPWDPGDTFLDDDPLNAPLAPLDTAGNATVSLWGGMVLLGNAPTNLAADCGVGYGKCTVEGLTIPGFSATDATYGGVRPHDSSGVLEYVSIRHGGDEIGSGNELNCLTIAGVGDGTVLRNVECYVNFDDGFEWFGGTVDGENLAAFFIGDDTFDIDQGYTGVNQRLFGIMPFFNQNDASSFGSASGDKGGEWDGDDLLERSNDVNVRVAKDFAQQDNNTSWPFPNPSVWNMTLIGSTPDAGQCFTPASPAADNRGIQMRHGFAGNIFNSIIVNTGTQGGISIDTDAGEGASDTITHVNSGLVALVSSTLDDVAAPGAAENTVIANGNALNASLGGSANVVNSGLFNGLVQEDATFDPTGNAAGKLDSSLLCGGAEIDPRPAPAFTGVSGGVPPTITGLESGTTRGAFSASSAVQLWTTGWTTLNRAGLLAD